MRVNFYGQSCIGLEIGGTRLLFDPFIRQNELAANVDVSAISADYLLITHGHFDHVADAVELAGRTGATVITNGQIGHWLEKQGVTKTQELAIGGSMTLPFGKVKYVNAVHGSTLPDGADGGLAGGFVVETAEGNFYHTGDTALTMDMQLIPMATKLDWAAVCIGGHYTMDVADAVRAAAFIQCDKILGIHYDTFPPIRIDQEEAKKQFAAAGKELVLMPIGSAWDF